MYHSCKSELITQQYAYNQNKIQIFLVCHTKLELFSSLLSCIGLKNKTKDCMLQPLEDIAKQQKHRQLFIEPSKVSLIKFTITLNVCVCIKYEYKAFTYLFTTVFECVCLQY